MLDSLITALALGCFGTGVQAGSDLNVAPTRLTLCDTALAGSITLVNRGKSTVRYRLKLIDMIMESDGTLTRSPIQTLNSASELIHFAPREIVLGPTEMQKVRILAILPPGLPPGEYRSHLALEPVLESEDESSAPAGPNTLKLNFRLKTAVTLPVFVTHGQVDAVGAVDGLTVERTSEGCFATFHLTRHGNRTVRGNCRVIFTPKQGQNVILGQVIELPIYFPNTEREVKLKLSQDPANLGPGHVSVEFTDSQHPVKAGGTAYAGK